MSDTPQDLRRICWSECFGFTQIFRAFRLAIHPNKLILAFLLVVLTYVSGRIMDGIWAKSSMPIVMSDLDQNELTVFIQSGGSVAATKEWTKALDSDKSVKRWGPFRVLLKFVRTIDDRIIDAVWGLSIPGIVGALMSLLLALVWLFVMHPLYGIVLGFATMSIWSYLGGAICRVAALHATRDERISIGEALAFTKEKCVNFFLAPIMPTGVVLLLGLGLWVAGAIGLIPAVGEVIVGLLFFLALLAGFAIAFVIIGGIAGCSFTYPTIAVEGSDAFDAFSRTFSYIYARPWRTAFYSFVAIAYGAICFMFIKLFVRIMLWSVAVFMGFSMNSGSVFYDKPVPAKSEQLPKLDAIWQGPSLIGESAFYGSFEGEPLAHMSWFAQILVRLWIYVVWAMVAAFLVSFYFSASTLIYLLLRREVDATDLEDVYLEDTADDVASMSKPPDAPTGTGSGTSLPVIGQ